MLSPYINTLPFKIHQWGTPCPLATSQIGIHYFALYTCPKLALSALFPSPFLEFPPSLSCCCPYFWPLHVVMLSFPASLAEANKQQNAHFPANCKRCRSPDGALCIFMSLLTFSSEGLSTAFTVTGFWIISWKPFLTQKCISNPVSTTFKAYPESHHFSSPWQPFQSQHHFLHGLLQRMVKHLTRPRHGRFV